MDVFYKHDVDIFFNGFGSLFTTFECCLCQDYSNTNEPNSEVQTNFRYMKTLLGGKFCILGEKLLGFIKIQI